MKFISLSFPFILVMDILVILNFVNWHKMTVEDYCQRELDLQVNYSCDAAAQMMLKRTSDIGNDYYTWGSISVDPVVAYNTYEECMLRNLDWGRSDYNRENFRDKYVPFFCVVGYDGYYMYQKTQKIVDYKTVEYAPLTDSRERVEGYDDAYFYWRDKDEDGNEIGDLHKEQLKPVKPTLEEGSTDEIKATTYPLEWTPKMPFSWTPNDREYYAVNLSYDWCYYYDTDTSKIDTKYYPMQNGVNLPEWKQKDIVSTKLSEACSTALKMALLGNTNTYLYVPSEVSVSVDTNPILGPSVITYVDNDYGNLQYGLSTFAVGGSRIDNESNVVCYEINGTRFYTYAYNNPSKLMAVYGYKVEILRTYTNPRLAAEDGWMFDMSMMD